MFWVLLCGCLRQILSICIIRSKIQVKHFWAKVAMPTICMIKSIFLRSGLFVLQVGLNELWNYLLVLGDWLNYEMGIATWMMNMPTAIRLTSSKRIVWPKSNSYYVVFLLVDQIELNNFDVKMSMLIWSTTKKLHNSLLLQNLRCYFQYLITFWISCSS